MLTPAAELQARLDAQRVLRELDLALRSREPVSHGWRDEPCYRDAAEDDMQRARDAERDEALFATWGDEG